MAVVYPILSTVFYTNFYTPFSSPFSKGVGGVGWWTILNSKSALLTHNIWFESITTPVWPGHWHNPEIPQCTCSISRNAPFWTEMCTFLFWMVHCRIRNRCIVRFVKLLYSCCMLGWAVFCQDFREMGTDDPYRWKIWGHWKLFWGHLSYIVTCESQICGDHMGPYSQNNWGHSWFQSAKCPQNAALA